jgi:FkbM family methyltransferase
MPLMNRLTSTDGLPRRLIRRTLAKWLPRNVGYPVLRGPLKGTRFILGSAAGEGGGASVYLNLSEPEQTQRFVTALHPGQVLFDIGANVGYYTLLGSRLVGPKGHVMAFEPVVRNLVFLYRHLDLNKNENVLIVPATCSNRLGVRTFYPGQNCALGHLASSNDLDKGRPSDSLIVPVVTVDEVVACAQVFPDVMKIDVEGTELQVLEGARDTLMKTKPLIFLSVHSAELRVACQSYLRAMNYSFEALSGNDWGPGEFVAVA